MAIDIEINPSAPEVAPPKEPQKVVELDMRRSLDGNLMIFDHEDIDIVLVPATNKVIAFPKSQAVEDAYGTQARFFDFLADRGIVNRDSVQGGNIFSSLRPSFRKARMLMLSRRPPM